MLNQTVIIGRIVKEPELIETEVGQKSSNLTLAVPRNYKNGNGEYDTDFIDCTLWNEIAENTVSYVNKGDLVGVKGRLETEQQEQKDGIVIKNTKVVVEKVTFLSSQKKDN